MFIMRIIGNVEESDGRCDPIFEAFSVISLSEFKWIAISEADDDI